MIELKSRFIYLPIPVTDVPEGYRIVFAYAKDDVVVVPLADLPEGEKHNCDWEGCSSISHVVRFSVSEKYKDYDEGNTRPAPSADGGEGLKSRIEGTLEGLLFVTDEWGGTKIAEWKWGHALQIGGIDSAAEEMMKIISNSPVPSPEDAVNKANGAMMEWHGKYLLEEQKAHDAFEFIDGLEKEMKEYADGMKDMCGHEPHAIRVWLSHIEEWRRK